jgi:hypothetical protein
MAGPPPGFDVAEGAAGTSSTGAASATAVPHWVQKPAPGSHAVPQRRQYRPALGFAVVTGVAAAAGSASCGAGLAVATAVSEAGGAFAAALVTGAPSGRSTLHR